jgi:hypothetical protein
MYEKQYKIQMVGIRYKSIFRTSFFSASVFSSKDVSAILTVPSSCAPSEVWVTASCFSSVVAMLPILSTSVFQKSRSGCSVRSAIVLETWRSAMERCSMRSTAMEFGSKRWPRRSCYMRALSPRLHAGTHRAMRILGLKSGVAAAVALSSSREVPHRLLVLQASSQWCISPHQVTSVIVLRPSRNRRL